MKKTVLFSIVLALSFSQNNRISIFSNISYSIENKDNLFNKNGSLFDFNPQAEYIKINAFYNYKSINMDLNIDFKSQAFQEVKSAVTVRELYYENSITDNFEFFIGRKLFRNGAAYYQNPTGFLNSKKEAADVTDRLKQTIGRDALGLNYYFEDSDIELVYTPYYSNDDKLKLLGHELSAKYYILLGSTDISILYNYHSEFKNQIGFSLAQSVNDYLEVHSEIALKNASDEVYHEITNTKNPFQVYSDSPYKKRKDDRVNANILIGINLSTEFGLNIISEYLYDSEKLKKSEWTRLVNYSTWLDEQDLFPKDAVDGNKKWIAQSLNFQREYFFNRFAYSINDINFSFISIHNLYDASMILIPELSFSYSAVSFILQSTFFIGSKSSDYGNLFTSNTSSLSLSYSF